MSSTQGTLSNPIRQTGIQRSILILIVGMAVLLVAGIVATLIAVHRPEASYPANSPQRTVATYLRLLQDGRLDQAYRLTYFVRGDGTVMSLSEWQGSVNGWNDRSHRVTLLRASTSGNTASVDVEISSFNGNIFGGSDNTNRQTFTLVRRHGAWRITGPE